MIDDIFSPGDIWSRNELNAMVADSDLFPFESVYVTWDFLEGPITRLKAIRMMYRSRAIPVGLAAEWVAKGGKFPNEIELQEPRRKKYIPLAQRK
ncbi:MAG: hypothetical protein RL149_194 [Actinomycetota bacterium]|jgi:hypothetical protein